MSRLFAGLLCLAMVVSVHGGGFLFLGEKDETPPRRDLYFSEAFFYANQGDYFSALQRMDAELIQHYGVDEPALDSLHFYVGKAEFSVGDFELNYRMHNRASKAITAIFESSVDEAVRNEAGFRLARIHFQKAQLKDALQVLDGIHGRIPDSIRDEVAFLRANIYLAMARPDNAVEVLQKLQNSDDLKAFSAYNLGVALWRAGAEKKALEQLDKAGRISSDDLPDKAIKDKANLVMGTLLMDSGSYLDAMMPLERVRLQGPFSNQALLSSGWADMSADQIDRAVVPWSILAKRDSTDAAVQEAKLALPYAYSRLEVYGRAAILYGEALESFNSEIQKLEASIESINNGNFLQALIREEVHHDKDWVIHLRDLPETPETFYLAELMASHDFQTALQNYLDLEDLRTRLKSWQGRFAAYQDLIDARQAFYEPLLPDIDSQFRRVDSRMKLRFQQYELLDKRMQDLLVMPRPEMLATTEERIASERLALLEKELGSRDDVEAVRLRARLARLNGVITWQVRTQYDKRLTEFHKHLRELQVEVDALKETYHAFVRARQAASHSYEGYEKSFYRIATRVDEELETITTLMNRQGRVIEQVAIAELEMRHKRLKNYQNQARYAMADSYDRATKALQARNL